MPRWKALPEDVDPQVKEFASQLRRLVDRSGLSIAALADRTGYSRTSWERYLNGRLLAPKGAVVALAEVTDTNPVHLTTMWELAERAWSRAELRHDRTMEAIRIAQARAALGEFGAPAPGTESNGTLPDGRQSDGPQVDGRQPKGTPSGGTYAKGAHASGTTAIGTDVNGAEAKRTTVNGAEAKRTTVNGTEAHGGETRNGRTNGGKGNGGKVRVPRWGSAQAPGALLAGIAGPAGVSPTVPPQPTASDADARERGAREREGRAREAREQGPRAAAPAPGSRTGTGGGARTAPEAAPAAGSRAESAAATVVKSSGGAHGTHGDAGTGAVTDSESGSVPGSGSGPVAGPARKVNSWGVAGYRGPAPMGGKRESGGAATAPDGEPPQPPHPAVPGPAPVPAPGPVPVPGSVPTPVPGTAPAAVPGAATAAAAPAPAPGTGVSPAAGPAPAPAPAPGGMFRRQLAMFFAGMAATLLVIGVVFYFTGGFGGTRTRGATASPSPSATTGPSLPPGVKCAGEGCTGKDAEAMGCSGERGTTDRSVTVGTTLVEVRYSKTCGAAWGRITQAEQGDEVKVTVGTRTRTDTLATPGDTIAYTPMLPVKDAAQATVCVTLATGQQGCTR
ncbi:helix-turn-helix domain-containing protein [Streptomyces sp. NRRL S-340]|uniref:helix-turn-helix domain-containing protein n=1 Tax=Streptomyces sp. NRRL S-340 TaxID=1463901 RepID=UPI00056CAB28|nr:XRE family transcriptional regulator [Streptomyces sp. NRRL S-340]